MSAESAIYIPANGDLDAVLADLPRDLRPYRDHAALLLHFVAVKRWLDNVDRGGFARLHSLVLRRYIPDRRIRPIIELPDGAVRFDAADIERLVADGRKSGEP